MGKIDLPRDIDGKASLRVIQKRRCELSLATFIKQAWPILEPSQQYLHNWHVDMVAAHLEAITDGHVLADGTPYSRLLINIPPGSMKSMLLLFWQAWEWGPRGMSWKRYIRVSHSQSLAIRDTVRLRRLVSSEWYQERWPIDMTSDVNSKIKFELKTGGFSEAAAAGSITGSRADAIIVDDANSVEGATSDAMRTSTNLWFQEALPTRLNNPRTSAIIVICQRLHEEDVSGLILENKAFKAPDGSCSFDHLVLPMRYEAWRSGMVTKLGYADPREEEDELLFPARFPIEVVQRDERALGPYAVAGQFQQVPTPRGGGIIKDSWWQLWDHTHFPDSDFVVASIDTAYTTKSENDFSAMTVWGVFSGDPAATATRSVDRYGKGFDGYVNTSYTSDLNAVPRVILMRAWAERLELHELVEKIAKDCKALKVDKLLIENKAAGHSVAQEIRRLFSHEPWAVQMYDPKSIDKLGRLYSVQHLFAEGMIYAPGVTWAEQVIRQVSSFPRGKHDDLVDTVSMALRHLRDLGLLTRSPERLAEINESKTQYGKAPPPLYDA